jgi:hypothetical protein
VVACEDDDDNDVDIPLVSVYFRWKSVYTILGDIYQKGGSVVEVVAWTTVN